MVYEPSMTHAASFGFVALFVAASMRWMSPAMGPRESAVLGALLGLAFVTRPQEAVFALFPAALLLTADAPLSDRVRAAVRLALWALAGAAVFLTLQATHSAILFSRERFALVGADGYLDFLQFAMGRHVMVVVARLPVVDAGRLCRARGDGGLRHEAVALGAPDAGHRLRDGMGQRLDR